MELNSLSGSRRGSTVEETTLTTSQPDCTTSLGGEAVVGIFPKISFMPSAPFRASVSLFFRSGSSWWWIRANQGKEVARYVVWPTFAVPESVAWPVICSGAGEASAGWSCSNNDQIQCTRRVRITPAWSMRSGMGLRALELEPTGAGLGERPAPRAEIFLILCNSFLTDGRGPLPDRICEGWGEDSWKISLQTISSCEVDVPYLCFLRRSAASLAW